MSIEISKKLLLGPVTLLEFLTEFHVLGYFIHDDICKSYISSQAFSSSSYMKGLK